MSEKEIQQTILHDLSKRYGEVIGGALLSKVLGYPTMAAMKVALGRKTLSIPTFFIPGRRGRFALTSEVATWLAEHRATAGQIPIPTPNQLQKK